MFIKRSYFSAVPLLFYFLEFTSLQSDVIRSRCR